MAYSQMHEKRYYYISLLVFLMAFRAFEHKSGRLTESTVFNF